MLQTKFTQWEEGQDEILPQVVTEDTFDHLWLDHQKRVISGLSI